MGIGRRQSIIKKINQRLADEWKAGRQNDFATKEIERAIISSGHYRLQPNGRPTLINDKWWDAPERKNLLNSLNRIGTASQRRKVKQAEKEEKEKKLRDALNKNYEDEESELISEIFEDEEIQEELEKLENQSLQEYVESETDLHELINNYKEYFYVLEDNSNKPIKMIVDALHRDKTENKARLYLYEEMQLRSLISYVDSVKDDITREIMKNRNSDLKVGE
ncbi:MAG: hypothetical protein MJ237_08580 [bacterium]|nr:hypothetical protein [bacterium]